MEQTIKQRQIAYKIDLSEIFLNEFIKQEGWEPNYVAYGNKKISRVNVIGTVISPVTPEQNYIVIDDGKANIMIRQFENQEIDLMDYDIGHVVNIIGKIREFNNERYILPEIIKQVSPKWLVARKKELDYLNKIGFYNSTNPENNINKPASLIIEETIKIQAKDSEEIIKKIRELDKGDGAEVESITKLCGTESEKMIKTLLEQGDIFTTKPGRVKVLE